MASGRIVAASVALQVLAAALSGAGPALARATIAVGARAPVFRLATLNAESCGQEALSLKRHVGPRAKEPRAAVVLSFMASWCKPCREELPQLKELMRGYARQDVLAAIVITDTEAEGREAARRLAVDELQPPFPVVADLAGIVTRRYGAEKLPFLVLVDRDGLVRWLQQGGADPIGGLAAALAELGVERDPGRTAPSPTTPRRSR